MFVILKFGKKRGLFWRAERFVKSTNNGYFTELLCSQPKNQKQFIKLIKILNQYSGKIIYPKGYYKKGMPKPYPSLEYKIRVLMKTFLKYAQKDNPDCAVINGCDRVKEEYLLNLSSYVGKIILYNAPQNTSLQLKTLSHSGTPIIYSNEIPSNSFLLNLNEKNSVCFNNNVKYFGLDNIYDLQNPLPPLPSIFQGLDEFCIRAAMNELWNIADTVDKI